MPSPRSTQAIDRRRPSTSLSRHDCVVIVLKVRKTVIFFDRHTKHICYTRSTARQPPCPSLSQTDILLPRSMRIPPAARDHRAFARNRNVPRAAALLRTMENTPRRMEQEKEVTTMGTDDLLRLTRPRARRLTLLRHRARRALLALGRPRPRGALNLRAQRLFALLLLALLLLPHRRTRRF